MGSTWTLGDVGVLNEGSYCFGSILGAPDSWKLPPNWPVFGRPLAQEGTDR